MGRVKQSRKRRPCLGQSAQFCGPFGSKETFETNSVYKGVSGFVIPAPELTGPVYDPSDPTKIPVVGFEDSLTWDTKGDGGDCAHFHKLIITRENDGTTLQALEMGSFNFDFDLEDWTDSDNPPQEKIWRGLDEVYTWNAEPCFIRDKENIECEGTLSETWKFKTTGAIPQNLQSEVTNRTRLSWDEVEKAGSYRYQLAADDAFSDIKNEETTLAIQITLDYPNVEPNTPYWWHVASCADGEGVICGEWGAPQTFTTLPINPPSAPVNPANQGKMFIPGSLSWEPDPGASYYQYHIEYVCRDPEETLEECMDVSVCGESGVPKVLVDANITSSTSAFLSTKCTGQYHWAVASCADKDCAVVVPDDPADVTLWSFTGRELPAEEEFGLVPCGRNSNNDATPYNEKEDCGLKHVGFLLQNILDFVLWKLSLIVLAVLAVFVAASTYFSFGSPDVITRVRSVFRSYFYGVLILLFAWAIVNLIMAVFGFNVNFFGNWYEIPF